MQEDLARDKRTRKSEKVLIHLHPSANFTLLERLSEEVNLSSHLPKTGDMASRVATLLLLVVICVGFTTAQIVVDCCLETGEKRLPLHILDSYVIQEAGNGCKIDATVFITKARLRLCAPPPSSQHAWVRKNIDHLNKKNQKQ